MLQMTVIGNIGNDATIKQSNGEYIVNFSVAHNREVADKETGELKKFITWVSCSLFSKTEPKLTQYLVKGMKVYISGRPQINTYRNKQGVECAEFSLVSEHIELLGKSREVLKEEILKELQNEAADTATAK